MRTYNLFISHSWNYSDAYNRLVDLLNSRPYFAYKNFSVSEDNPIEDGFGRALIEAAIRRKMQLCNCVIILAGVYATYSKWINIEIRIAQSLGKPIIAIEPWGAERTSLVVKNAAHSTVKWNKESLISEIRKLA